MAMLRLWLTSREGGGRIPLWKGLAVYTLAHVLPDAWFSWLIVELRRRADISARSDAGSFRSLKDA